MEECGIWIEGEGDEMEEPECVQNDDDEEDEEQG